MDEKQPKTKLGAPSKRDMAVVRVAEALGITLACDIMSLDDLKNFPDISNEKPRNQGIMCAYACGHGTPYIAKMFGVKQPTIFEIIKRIDPTGAFKPSPESKKAFMTQLAMTRGIEALSSITPEKLEESSAKELAGIAKMMGEFAAGLNQSKHKDIGSGKMDMMMASIEEERKERVEEAEFEVIKDNV